MKESSANICCNDFEKPLTRDTDQRMNTALILVESFLAASQMAATAKAIPNQDSEGGGSGGGVSRVTIAEGEWRLKDPDPARRMN